MIRQVDTALLRLGRYRRGDLAVIVAGSPPHTVGSTNLIHVHRVGEDDFTSAQPYPGTNRRRLDTEELQR